MDIKVFLSHMMHFSLQEGLVQYLEIWNGMNMYCMCRSEQPKMVEPLFGKARFYVLRYNFSHALEVLNQVVAGHPGFLPALVEKMKVQLALQDWEQAVETAHRCVGGVVVWGVCGGVWR